MKNTNQMVDAVSFQTNVLALNTGIVAARAGEAGRGFAVVASEIREPAKRSATASSEISTQIEKSAANVIRTDDDLGACTRLLEQIDQNIRELCDQAEISSSQTSAQASKIDAINSATVVIVAALEQQGKTLSANTELAVDPKRSATEMQSQLAYFE